MIDLNKKTLNILAGVFWGGVVLASVSLVMAITTGVIERKNAVRTQESGVKIAVPAE